MRYEEIDTKTYNFLVKMGSMRSQNINQLSVWREKKDIIKTNSELFSSWFAKGFNLEINLNVSFLKFKIFFTHLNTFINWMTYFQYLDSEYCTNSILINWNGICRLIINSKRQNVGNSFFFMSH